MADIAKIDKNLAVASAIGKEDVCFYNIEQPPFQIYGVKKEGDRFRRMPEAVARQVNEGVYGLHANTAGGRVRFVTDSTYIAIHSEADNVPSFPHMPLVGVGGFDLYTTMEEGERYLGSFVPPYGMKEGYDSVIDFALLLQEKKERVFTINFPLYSDVKALFIGVAEGSVLKEAPGYGCEKPVVYYGSSITQGGCASRPGMSYQGILHRKYDYDYINLGFSGSARAEDVMIDYIKNLDMSVYVHDYDHNAPTPEHLHMTHEKMYKAVREAHPDIPILLLSRPKYFQDQREQEAQRLEIIRTTYRNALAAGDRNVYLIEGDRLMALAGGDGLVDYSHPTDLGFASMAQAISEVFDEIL